jgi:hypothetical protein
MSECNNRHVEPSIKEQKIGEGRKFSETFCEICETLRRTTGHVNSDKQRG